MNRVLIIIIIVAAPLFMLSVLTVLTALSILLFVSIVWTHRPDLSVGDIFRECVQKIKSWLKENIRAGREEK